MTRTPARAIAALCLVAAVTGCSSGLSLNPFSWFSRPAQTDTLDVVALPSERDARPLVTAITALTLEPVPGGALLTAVGMPASTGWSEAGLVVEPAPAPGTLVLSFRAVPPTTAALPGTAFQREVTVATWLPDSQLARTALIEVRAATNARTLRP